MAEVVDRLLKYLSDFSPMPMINMLRELVASTLNAALHTRSIIW